MELKIDGTDYDVQELTPSEEGEFLRGFRLEKLDAKKPTVYDVVKTDDEILCDCPDFKYRRAGLDSKGCKHIQAIIQAGLLEKARVKTKEDFEDMIIVFPEY